MTELSAWQPRYCAACHEHIEITSELKSEELTSQWTLAFECLPPLWLLVFAGSAAFLGIDYPAALLAFGIAVVLLWIYHRFERRQQARAARHNALLLREVHQKMTSQCCHHRPSVWLAKDMRGQSRFVFRNIEFAELFKRINGMSTL
jgi:hypothetical protein